MKYTIIADSSCDLKSDYIKSDKVNFATVPLSITMNGEDWFDTEELDTRKLVDAMKINKSKPQTACPSVEAFAEKMREGEDHIICVSITSKLSGTYNAARLAANQVMEEDPAKKIYVLDTLSVSAAAVLMIDKAAELIEGGEHTFDQITHELTKMRENTHLRFLLQDLSNLVKTGRMSKVKGAIASALSIKLICGDNGEGEIKQYAKSIGMKKALPMLAEYPGEKVLTHGKDIPVVITHCYNEEEAKSLKNMLEALHGLTNIKILPMRGLASFYANDKGIIMAY